MAARSESLITVLMVVLATTTGAIAQGAGGPIFESKDRPATAGQYHSGHYVLTSDRFRKPGYGQDRREAIKALGIGGKTSSGDGVGNGRCSDLIKGRSGDVVGNGRSGDVVGNGRCTVEEIYRHRRERLR